MPDIEGLDQEAWNRWESYRSAIKKPIREASRHAMQLKLLRYGDQQAAVVDQSIENQWQGLFDLQEKKNKPGAQRRATQAEIDANSERLAMIEKHAERTWQKVTAEQGEIGLLRVADALLARYTLEDQQTPWYAERLEWLRIKVGELISRADIRQVYADPGIRGMVLQLWGDAGLRKLRKRAEAQEPGTGGLPRAGVPRVSGTSPDGKALYHSGNKGA